MFLPLNICNNKTIIALVQPNLNIRILSINSTFFYPPMAIKTQKNSLILYSLNNEQITSFYGRKICIFYATTFMQNYLIDQQNFFFCIFPIGFNYLLFFSLAFNLSQQRKLIFLESVWEINSILLCKISVIYGCIKTSY